jgi:predicted nuclease with TOPRIM domain
MYNSLFCSGFWTVFNGIILSNVGINICGLRNLKNELKNQTLELQKTVSQLQDKITGLEDKLGQDQTELKKLNSLNRELQDASEKKENILRERDERINELNMKIELLDKQVGTVKGQSPKKPVLEESESLNEGPECPHCHSRTNEIYKDIEGKKQLMRRYCTNPNCGFMEYIS